MIKKQTFCIHQALEERAGQARETMLETHKSFCGMSKGVGVDLEDANEGRTLSNRTQCDLDLEQVP